MRANSKDYLRNFFPNLVGNKVTTSKRYESKERPNYLNNWWFKFGMIDLEEYKYIVFAGALDYENKKFIIFKVPSKYFLENIDKIDMTEQGWINLYLSFDDYIDLRNENNLPFKQFIVK